jgi:hypothetical protein
MQFVIGNMQASSEGSLGSNIMAVLSPLLLPIDAVF